MKPSQPFPNPLYALHKYWAVNRALTCKGWTSGHKLGMLYDLAQQTRALSGDILEIGSAWGRSTVLLGKATRKTIWSIDPHTGGLAYIQQKTEQGSFDEFKQNLARHGLANRVQILKFTTHEVVEQHLLPYQIRFAMIFIDGLHTAEGVLIDFNFSFQNLLSNGIMVFDDYFEPSVPDYTERIDHLMHNHALELNKDPRTKLTWFTKP